MSDRHEFHERMLIMTPKEKAKELTHKFETAIVEELLGGDHLYKYTAKQCALICVDEIQEIKSVDHDIALYDYWEEVKTEIEKP